MQSWGQLLALSRLMRSLCGILNEYFLVRTFPSTIILNSKFVVTLQGQIVVDYWTSYAPTTTTMYTVVRGLNIWNCVPLLISVFLQLPTIRRILIILIVLLFFTMVGSSTLINAVLTVKLKRSLTWKMWYVKAHLFCTIITVARLVSWLGSRSAMRGAALMGTAKAYQYKSIQELYC